MLRAKHLFKFIKGVPYENLNWQRQRNPNHPQIEKHFVSNYGVVGAFYFFFVICINSIVIIREYIFFVHTVAGTRQGCPVLVPARIANKKLFVLFQAAPLASSFVYPPASVSLSPPHPQKLAHLWMGLCGTASAMGNEKNWEKSFGKSALFWILIGNGNFFVIYLS